MRRRLAYCSRFVVRVLLSLRPVLAFFDLQQIENKVPRFIPGSPLPAMSAFGGKADMAMSDRDVCF